MSFKSKTLKLLIMRKFALIAIVLSLMVSCQKKQSENPKSLMKNQSNSTCINLEDYEKLTDIKDKVDWLKEYGELVCKDTLNEAILAAHEIDTSDIENLHPVGFSINWKTLREFIEPNFYNAYLSFTLNGTSDVTAIKLVPDFSETVPCYSVPFILYLGEKEGLNDACSIEFRTGNLKAETVLLVITKDESNNIINYYDASGNPI